MLASGSRARIASFSQLYLKGVLIGYSLPMRRVISKGNVVIHMLHEYKVLQEQAYLYIVCAHYTSMVSQNTGFIETMRRVMYYTLLVCVP